MNDRERPSNPTTKHLVHASEETTEKHPTIGGQERRTIGEYVLIRRIGGGGMGVVYEAEHMRLKRRVAVKVISDSYLAKPTAAPRFFREMEAAGKLEHPHIVQATDAGVDSGVPYLVMEYVAGADLARIVRQYGPLPPLAALEAIDQTGEALAHIHEHNMVHRDIKPSNLLLNRVGKIKVADLGLAHLIGGDATDDHVTATGDVVGTVEYMAPEQARDAKVIDHRADIYSLGCCMHFLFCGSPVFRTDSRVDCLIAHRTVEVPELVSWHGIPLPPSLNGLFQDILAKRPENRPQSIYEVLNRLRKSRDELRELLGTTDKAKTITFGGRSLPVDAGLETTAHEILAHDSPYGEAGALQTTLQLRREPRQKFYGRVAIAGCIVAVLLVAILAIRKLQTATLSPEPTHIVATKNGLSNFAEVSAPPNVQFVLDAHPGGAVFNVRFSQDGQHLLSCGSDGVVRVWDLESKQQLQHLQHLRGLNGLHVIDVALIPNSPHAVSVCYNGIATVWNWQTGAKLRQFELHRNQVEAVAWISGTKVLTTGRDDAMYVWDVNNGEVLARLDNSHSGGVRAVAVDSDSRRAVTADYSGNVMLWSLEPGREQLIRQVQLATEANEIWSIDWIGNSSRVAIGGIYASGKSLLIVYDLENDEVVREFSQLTGRVYGVRASRDGRFLYSAADDVHAWSLDQEIDEPVFEFTRHNDNVFSVDESPDGKHLVSGGTDGTVRVFEWRDTTEKSP